MKKKNGLFLEEKLKNNLLTEKLSSSGSGIQIALAPQDAEPSVHLLTGVFLFTLCIVAIRNAVSSSLYCDVM